MSEINYQGEIMPHPRIEPGIPDYKSEALPILIKLIRWTTQ